MTSTPPPTPCRTSSSRSSPAGRSPRSSSRCSPGRSPPATARTAVADGERAADLDRRGAGAGRARRRARRAAAGAAAARRRPGVRAGPSTSARACCVVFLPQVVLYGVGDRADRGAAGPPALPRPCARAAAVEPRRRSRRTCSTPPRGRRRALADLSRAAGAGAVGRARRSASPCSRSACSCRCARAGCGCARRCVPARGRARGARGWPAGGVAGLAAQQLALVVALRLAAGGARGRGRGAHASPPRCSCCRGRCWPSRSRRAPSRRCRRAPSRRRAAYAAALAGRRPLGAARDGRRGGRAGRRRARRSRGCWCRARPGAARSAELAAACAAFAPGLVGYGLLALLARACYARGRARTAAGATVAGWLVVAVADVALVAALPDVDRVRAARRRQHRRRDRRRAAAAAALRRAGAAGRRPVGRCRARRARRPRSALGALTALCRCRTARRRCSRRPPSLGAAAGGVLPGRAPAARPGRAAGAAACLSACLLVLATSTGGVGRHVRVARRRAARPRGCDVTVAGPASTGRVASRCPGTSRSTSASGRRPAARPAGAARAAPAGARRRRRARPRAARRSARGPDRPARSS